MVPIVDFLKRSKTIVKLYHYLKLVVEHRSLIPDEVCLEYSGNLLFANPLEFRGRSLLLNRGKGQPLIKEFWRIAILNTNPDLVLDIGMNYGEVLFDLIYPRSVKLLIGVEANPLLIKYCQKSGNAHPDSDRIRLCQVLASNENAANGILFVDKNSSGRSSAFSKNFVKRRRKIKVPVSTIDTIVSRLDFVPKKFVFKIDVEGYEPYVLRGMDGLLRTSSEAAGCIEINLEILKKNSVDINNYIEELNRYFVFLIPSDDGSLNPYCNLSEGILQNHFSNKYCEGDIFLFSSRKMRRKFSDKYRTLAMMDDSV